MGIPKRFKPLSIHDVSGCDARSAVRDAINQGLQVVFEGAGIHPTFQKKFTALLHRYVGCLPLVDICGETLPSLWAGWAESSAATVEGSSDGVRWTYYFLVTWDNFH